MAPKRKPLSAAVEKNLREKAKKSRFTYGQLARVYRRGQGAYLSGGSRNVSMAAWAMGRVKSFIRGSRKHDTDLRKGGGSGKKTKKMCYLNQCSYCNYLNLAL